MTPTLLTAQIKRRLREALLSAVDAGREIRRLDLGGAADDYLRTLLGEITDAVRGSELDTEELEEMLAAPAPTSAPGALPPLERALGALATVVTDGNALSLDLANLLTVATGETRGMAAEALRGLRDLVLEASTEHGVLAPSVRIDGEG